MIEQKAMAYVNMWGVLGSLEDLCRLDDKAKKILATLKKPVSLCFSVKGGPTCTFHFSKDGCTMTHGSAGATAKMTFSSPAKFNDLINNSKPGIPSKNPVSTLTFLTGAFTKLTDRLNEVLRPDKKALEDPAFFELNTLMTLYVLAGTIPALADYDSISKLSAAATVDGEIQMGITDKAYISIIVKNHYFTVKKTKSDNPRGIMEFADIRLANGLFNGTVAALQEMCKGTIYLTGMISMIDNVNRILDRASVYLS